MKSLRVPALLLLACACLAACGSTVQVQGSAPVDGSGLSAPVEQGGSTPVQEGDAGPVGTTDPVLGADGTGSPGDVAAPGPSRLRTGHRRQERLPRRADQPGLRHRGAGPRHQRARHR